ncbi:MAG: rRNA (cytosine967-C5)-methyltransferase, partial [Solirubrobacterales bacterium]|nr:rRNA (cytosine967-C5)-methyltransferase [Solirubrobacterales bacterium]
MIAPARRLAFATLRETFEDGAHTERAFRAGAERLDLEGRERAQAQRLAYGAVQRRGTADTAIERLANRSPNLLDPPVIAALRLGLYELLFADGTPDHAAVDQAVELVKSARVAHAAGLVNAVLRRAARERERLLADLLGDDSTPEKAAVAHSAPLWLVRLWWEELGPEIARALLAACNQPAEVAFRAREPEAALTKLREAGVEAAPASGGWPLRTAETIVISGRTGPLVSELVAAGELTPQSRGSAAVVEVLDPGLEDHVLDLCAGPGIKTGQIAERREDRGQLISVELDPERAEEVAAQATRLHLHSATIFEADATSMQLPEEFDLALVDAPCSDLGALASRPDARWRKSPQTIERVTAIQDAVLRAAARALRPGGALVYSTCTISRAENE